MSITLQALQPDGTWCVRNAFITENAKVNGGSMKADDLETLARQIMSKWHSNAPDGKQLRIHNSATDAKNSERQRRIQRAETEARSNGWLTDRERHGEAGESFGVVHPDGHWAADWQSAVVFHDAIAAKSRSLSSSAI